MEELKKLSQGEEINVEVVIDEEEYRKAHLDLIMLDVKGKSMKTTKRRQRRHSAPAVFCERDVPEDMDVEASGRRASLSYEVLTEEEAWRISKDVGQHYKDLAWELKLTGVELGEIEDEKNGKNPNREKTLAVLHKWMQKQGSDATKGCLAFALDKIDRRDIAESLIGKTWFLWKKKDQQTFILKEEARIHCITADVKNFKDAVQEQRGSSVHVGFDKTINPAVAFWNFEVERKQKRELESFQEQLRMHENDLKEIRQSILKRQERQEDKIEVALQLDENEKQVEKIQIKVSSLIRLADDAFCYPKENFIPKQIYDLSISFSAVVQDLEERVKILLGIINRDKEVELELRLNKLSERCLSLRNCMQEKIYLGSLKELTIQRYHSASAQSSREIVPDESISTRHNTVPKSSREQKEMEEQIKPQKDPMEKDDDVLTSNKF